MQAQGRYKKYLRSNDGSIPRRSAYRYIHQYAALDEPDRPTDDLLSEESPPAEQEQFSSPSQPTSFSGQEWGGLNAGVTTLGSATAANQKPGTASGQLPLTAASKHTCIEDTPQDPMVCILFYYGS